MYRTIPYTCLLSLLFAAACGGKTAEPKTPEDESAETASSEEAPKEAAAEETESASAEEPAEEEPEPTMKRSAKDIVTGEGVLFMFSFNASEAYQKAEKECDEKAKDDLKKRADCMSKAAKQFEADGMTFKQDDDGKWWWITIRRRGANLTTLHKIEFEFGEDSEDKVIIKPKGRDKGSKPMARIPNEVVIEVPSSATIALDDPKFGKMVYEAKLGLLGETER